MKRLSTKAKTGILLFPAFLGIGVAAASGAEIDNYLKSKYIKTDGILATEYAQEINRSAETNLDSIFGSGTARQRYAIDPIIGVSNILTWLETKEAKDKYGVTWDFAKRRYQSLLSDVSNEKRTENYGKSLSKLSKAVADGLTNPGELKDVEDGHYMIIKRGEDWSVPALVKIYTPEAPADVSQKISPGQTQIITVKEPTIPGEPEKPYEEVKIETEEVKEPEEERAEWEKRALALEAQEVPKKEKGIFGSLEMSFNANQDSFGLNLCPRINFSEAVALGLGLYAGVIPGKEIFNTTTPRSDKGIYVHSIKEESGAGIGGYGEIKIGSFTLKGGLAHWWSEIKTMEQVMENDAKKGEPNYPPTEKNKGFYPFIGGGLETKFNDKSNLGFEIIYGGKRGLYAGISITGRNGDKSKREAKTQPQQK